MHNLRTLTEVLVEIYTNRETIVNLLLSYGANLMLQSDSGQPTMDLAHLNNDESIIKLFESYIIK